MQMIMNIIIIMSTTPAKRLSKTNVHYRISREQPRIQSEAQIPARRVMNVTSATTTAYERALLCGLGVFVGKFAMAGCAVHFAPGVFEFTTTSVAGIACLELISWSVYGGERLLVPGV